MPWGCLRFVIVVFPDNTHLLFLLHWKADKPHSFWSKPSSILGIGCLDILNWSNYATVYARRIILCLGERFELSSYETSRQGRGYVWCLVHAGIQKKLSEDVKCFVLLFQVVDKGREDDSNTN